MSRRTTPFLDPVTVHSELCAELPSIVEVTLDAGGFTRGACQQPRMVIGVRQPARAIGSRADVQGRSGGGR
jgi:hypothetical protein